jgi:hypothetical protein
VFVFVFVLVCLCLCVVFVFVCIFLHDVCGIAHELRHQACSHVFLVSVLCVYAKFCARAGLLAGRMKKASRCLTSCSRTCDEKSSRVGFDGRLALVCVALVVCVAVPVLRSLCMPSPFVSSAFVPVTPGPACCPSILPELMDASSLLLQLRCGTIGSCSILR